LVFTRVRFVSNGREFFPWDSPAAVDILLNMHRDDVRRVWLRRLDVWEASWELRPDKDGLLAIWLPAGDYALLGTEDTATEYATPALTVVALLRVPSTSRWCMRANWSSGTSGAKAGTGATHSVKAA